MFLRSVLMLQLLIHNFFLAYFFKKFLCGPFLKSLLSLLKHCFCFIFWFLGYESGRTLSPRPGIKPTPLALESEVLTTGPPGKLICDWTCRKPEWILYAVWMARSKREEPIHLAPPHTQNICFLITMVAGSTPPKPPQIQEGCTGLSWWLKPKKPQTCGWSSCMSHKLFVEAALVAV